MAERQLYELGTIADQLWDMIHRVGSNNGWKLTYVDDGSGTEPEFKDQDWWPEFVRMMKDEKWEDIDFDNMRHFDKAELAKEKGNTIEEKMTEWAIDLIGEYTLTEKDEDDEDE